MLLAAGLRGARRGHDAKEVHVASELASRLLTGRALGKQTPWEALCCCGLAPEMEELADLGSGSGGTLLDLEQGARAWGSRGTLRANERAERGPELVLARGPGIGGGKARRRPVEDVGRHGGRELGDRPRSEGARKGSRLETDAGSTGFRYGVIARLLEGAGVESPMRVTGKTTVGPGRPWSEWSGSTAHC